MGPIGIFILCASAIALASGKFPVKEPKTNEQTAAVNGFLLKQKVILDAFQHVHTVDKNSDLYKIANALNWTDIAETFDDPSVVNDYLSLQKVGLLPRSEEFSVLRKSHIEEAVRLFRLLHQSDLGTFHQILAWARYNVNEGVFIYATTVAVLHRPDFEGVVLPAPYEIYPYYFFDAETIQAAQNSKLQGLPNAEKIDGVNYLVIDSNYTGWNKRANPEQALSYFTEDVTLNAWYYYFHADYPFWVDSKDTLSKNRRGEVYLHTHAQLLARYYLERLSNDLGEIPQFSWHIPFPTGYNPALTYYKGTAFPVRNNFYSTYNEQTYYPIEKLESLENRVKFAIDHGFYTLINGTVIDLSKPEAVEYFADLYKYTLYKNDGKLFGLLEVLGRTLLGTATENYSTDDYTPSVLEHFETSARDPAFYQLYGRLIRYYLQWRNKLAPYTNDEINFDGVSIETFAVDRLTTFFDQFDSDITNAVDVEPVGSADNSSESSEDFVIKARQWRLDHLPFTFNMSILSEKRQKAIVKVFIGPKTDAAGNLIEFNANRENFYVLDQYVVDLKVGRTIIARNSNQFTYYSKDRTSYYDLYKTVMTALNDGARLPIDFSDSTCGFPQHLILPKGKKGGLPVQLFVIVSEYLPPSTWVIQKDWFSSSNCRRDVDARSLGFPLDRYIDETVWYTPNMKYLDTTVYHKSQLEVNSSFA